MRFLLLNQYFFPDLSAVSQMMTDLAEDLVSAGAQVTVITGRQSYTGDVVYAPRETWRGIDIIRVPATRFGRDRLLGRAVDTASFIVSAGLRMALERRVDVAVTMSTPPFLPALGMLRKRLSRTKFVYWVQDLFPDAAVHLGVLSRGGLATRAFELLSRATLRDADAVITIGDCMAERIAAKGIAPEAIDIIHNWADGEAITEVARDDNWFRRDHRLDGKFVVLYSGNMGRGHTFDALLAAARALESRLDIVFLFIGGGPRRLDVERAAEGLANVRFLPYQPREHLAWSLGAADLAVITLQDEALGIMVPSKLYGHMASARPVLYVGPSTSTVARVIVDANCGSVVQQDDVDGILGFISRLAADPALGRRLGAAGRHVFDERFGRARSTSEFMAICRALAPERAA